VEVAALDTGGRPLGLQGCAQAGAAVDDDHGWCG
jgi:hypothetical protein